jgi:hypothetical protein
MQQSNILTGGFPKLRVIYKMQEEAFEMKSKVMKRRMVIFFNLSLFKSTCTFKPSED